LRRHTGLAGLAVAATLGVAACGGGGGSDDPVGALQGCIDDAGLKVKVEEVPADIQKSLHEVGKVSVETSDNLVFATVFEAPKDAAFYAKGDKEYKQYGSATVTYVKKGPAVDQVIGCIDSTGIGSAS
jgi:hypothetical protein